MTLDDVRKLVAPLHRRVVNTLTRAIVKRVDDGKKAQLLQLLLLADETKDDVERLQPYGFTSVPKEDAEAIVACIGGKRDHCVTILVEDRRYRVTNLESGEVAVYDATGSKIVLKKNGDIEVTPSSGKAKLDCDVHVTGDVTVDGKSTLTGDVTAQAKIDASGDVSSGGKISASGNVESGADVSAGGDVKAGAITLKTHVHQYTDNTDFGSSTADTQAAKAP